MTNQAAQMTGGELIPAAPKLTPENFAFWMSQIVALPQIERRMLLRGLYARYGEQLVVMASKKVAL